MQQPRRPKLIRNCRISESPAQENSLVMPEGVIRLKGAGTEIISLCDGTRSIEEILMILKEKYRPQDPSQLEVETLGFLEALRNKRVLDF